MHWFALVCIGFALVCIGFALVAVSAGIGMAGWLAGVEPMQTNAKHANQCNAMSLGFSSECLGFSSEILTFSCEDQELQLSEFGLQL